LSRSQSHDTLERLPYTHDPGWGAAAFSSLLAAAARFQVFAAAVDTDLVFDEDVETIRRLALGGQDLCPEAATVVAGTAASGGSDRGAHDPSPLRDLPYPREAVSRVQLLRSCLGR
jgi:hypothetical protein